jgi:2-polyprenyl-3-methyl-5-hydroxy-6-metoxy-1,4-benzoquinol methylase
LNNVQSHHQIKPWQSDLDHLSWIEFANLGSFANKRILDLGCGSGFLCQKLIDEGASKAVGIDIVKPDLPESPSWQFLQQNLDDSGWHALIAEKFDLIFAFDIVEHLDSPFRFLKSCHQVLSEGGHLILTTPNLMSWERYYKPMDWSGAKDPQHKTLFTKYSLDFLLKRVGFSLSNIRAPMRSLSFLGKLQPQIGGQIFCIARV